MSIEKTITGDLTMLRVDGDLVGENAEELRAAASECLNEGRHDFVIDLSSAETCDSAGLEVLTWLQRESEDRLGLVKLCAVHDTVRKILELTRLNHRFEDHYDTF